MNTFSVDSDRHNTNLVDGKPVNRWVYTTNLYPDFTLEAHGAYQFDYIGAPMHSKAWAYYAFVSNGHPVPQSLYHHLLDVWEASKKTHLNSGRFAYLQGKDWGRHVYGLYFIVPALVVIQNEFGDRDARLVEQLRFRAFEWEQRQSHGGSIFGKQFAYQTKGWPLIYDTDCYANLGLAYLLHQQAPEIPPESINTFQKKVEGNVYNKYAEFMHARSDDMFISFSWRHLSRRYPMGLFVPGDDYIVEWADGNLVSTAVVEGADMGKMSSIHNEQFFENGFVTTGRIRSGKRGARYGVDHYLSFMALPKDRIAVMIESMVAKENIRVTEQFGLSYHLPNDLFNDSVRRIYSERGETRLRSTKTKLDSITIQSKWLNIDDKLGVVSLLNDGRFKIRPGKRQMWYGQVTERIDYVKGSPRITSYQKGDVIQEQAYLLIGGDRNLTESVATSGVQWLDTDDALIKAVTFSDGTSNRLIVANFHQKSVSTTIRLPSGKRISMRLDSLTTVTRNELAGNEIIHLKDRSTMVLIPAGEFIMGASDSQLDEITQGDRNLKEIFKHEKPQHVVYLDSFYIDKYEITNIQFEEFVNATKYVTDAEREGWGYVWEGFNVWPRIRGANWRSPLGPESTIDDKMDHPVIQVSYNDALAYAKWAGKRLSTEAEWEKASRGTDGRLYPWGNRWDASRVNSWEAGPHTTTPVGSYPDGASPYGAQDMAGNVWEWGADWYHHAYYGFQQKWSNPRGPAQGEHRVLRGGTWQNNRRGTRCTHRDNYVTVPDFRVHLGGFRCAKSVSRFEVVSIPPANPEDVNSDGVVDLMDLVIVASQFNRSPPSNPAADVNRDGKVDVSDLIRVGSHFGERTTNAAPSTGRVSFVSPSHEQIATIKRALVELEAVAHPSAGAEIARDVLLLWLADSEKIVTETKLLPNFPSPFNAETWIPYQLVADAEVQLLIYNINGTLVRHLNLGHQTAGYYHDKSKAAYWDGRSETGELVSSGLYFYQLRANEFTSVKRMVIIK